MADFTQLQSDELARVHRRSLLPVWIFAAVTALFCGIAWLHHAYPQAPVPFVGELR